ncbi:MAG: DUF4160 domain-containing protein, partial [Cyanobacteria bacterium J06649_11]
YKFIIYFNDHDPRHVHVEKGGGRAKVMLEEEIEIRSFSGFKSKELRKILGIIVEHYDYLIQKWDETVN